MICARPGEKVGVTVTSGVCERATMQFAIGSHWAWYRAVQVGGFCSSWPALWQAARAQSDTRLIAILLFMRAGCLDRCRFSTGLAHRARHLAPAFEHLGIDLAPMRGEVDHQPRGDALVALDHALGHVVPARHDGELVENLVGDQGLAPGAVAG